MPNPSPWSDYRRFVAWGMVAIMFGLLLAACDVPWNAAMVVNETDQYLEVMRRDPISGDTGSTLMVISPGGDGGLQGDCEESLLARWEDGTVVAIREEPLCRGDTWVVTQPSG